MTAAHTVQISQDFRLDPKKDIRNAHGAPSWFELTTHDPETAKTWLASVLGWTFENYSLGGSDYLIAKVIGHEAGGIRKPAPGEPDSPFWTTYVAVADAEEIAKKAVVNGGRVIMPPTQMPGVGKITGIEHNTAGRILAVEYERPFA